MVAGSNPNLDRSEVKYGTEYRVEWIGPPYMSMQRPSLASDPPKSIDFGQTVNVKIQIPASANTSVTPDIKGERCLKIILLLMSNGKS